MSDGPFRSHLRTHRYTVAHLARLVGARYATAHAWASGTAVPSPEAAERIEAATGYPASSWDRSNKGWQSATLIAKTFAMTPQQVREDMELLGAVPFRRTYSPEDVARLDARRPPGIEYLIKRMGPKARKARRKVAAQAFHQCLLELVLTRAEAAARIGVSVTTVGIWLRGVYSPSPDRAEVIERELGFAATNWS